MKLIVLDAGQSAPAISLDKRTPISMLETNINGHESMMHFLESVTSDSRIGEVCYLGCDSILTPREKHLGVSYCLNTQKNFRD
jgi:hypothetical protein